MQNITFEFKAGDGNVYAVDEAQIIDWVNQKRMNGNSLIRTLPDGEWTPLSQVEELRHVCHQAAASVAQALQPSTQSAPKSSHAHSPPNDDVQPGKLQAVAVMSLVGGIISLIVCATLAATTFFIWITWIYSLVLGIMAIIYGSQMLGKNSVQGFSSAKTIAIMQIISIISCDFVNLTMGIVSLVFLNDEEVKTYLRNRGLSL